MNIFNQINKLQGKFIEKFLPQASKIIHTPIKRLILHEYQGAELLGKYNLPVLKGKNVYNAQEAYKAAQELKENFNGQGEVDFVVKAQAHTGGRGKGFFKDSGLSGGVHITSSLEEVQNLASKMIGYKIYTKQTGSSGKLCSSVWVVERAFLRREMYLSILVDRQNQGISIVVNPKGGVNIEEGDPNLIKKVLVKKGEGLTEEQCQQVVNALQLSSNLQSKAVDLVKSLYKIFEEKDATLLEINPLGLTIDNQLLICDSKISIDENSKFRQLELFEQEDLTQKDTKEIEAAKSDLNYIALDGNIGCMVNGAGLAMATMDLMKIYNGLPANFLDVGGKAKGDEIVAALKILNNDVNVEAILVNIFAGITKCDEIAWGLIRGCVTLGMKKPIVVRLAGTNFQQARELVKDSGFNMFFTENLEEAAEKAVKMATILRMAREVNLDIQLRK